MGSISDPSQALGTTASPTFEDITLTNVPTATVATGDKVLIQDINDSDATKTVTAQSIADLAAPSTAAIEFISSADASSDATIDFALTGTYKEYILKIQNLVPASAAAVYFRTSTDGGSTFAAGASDYSFASRINTDGGASADSNINTIGFISPTGNYSMSNTASEGGFSGEIHIYDPAGTVGNKYVDWHAVFAITGSDVQTCTGGGVRNAVADVDAIRILMGAGNIASGFFALYGVNRA